MSEIAQNARVSIIVSDYANVDAGGKLNVLGGAVAIVGLDPMQGLTSRFSLAVVINVPTQYLPGDFALEISLRNEAGELVMLPGATEPQPLRVSQPVSLERPAGAATPAARDHLGTNHIAVLDFGGGLPLAVGGLYEWHVRIDGDDETAVRYPFAIAGPAQGMVFG